MRHHAVTVLLVAGLTAAGALWAFHYLTVDETARIDTTRGQTVRTVPLRSDGTVVAQAFESPPGGPGTVCTRLDTPTGTTTAVILRVHADADGKPGPILVREPVEVTGGRQDACVDVKQRVPAGATRLWLTLQRGASQAGTAEVHLLATHAHSYRPGRLLVAGRAVWGTLDLRVTAPGSTRLQGVGPWPTAVPRPDTRSGVVTMLLAASASIVLLVLPVAWTMPTRRLATATVAGGALLSLGVATLTSVRAPETPRRPLVEGRTLIDELWAADMRTSWPALTDAFAVEASRIGGTEARVLLALPASEVRWRIDVDVPVSLDTAAALREEAWHHPGDGAGFTVAAVDADSEDVLWSAHVDPYADPSARAWHDVTVRLDRYVGRTVVLVLRTDAGPHGNAVRDAAMWREPVLRPSR